MIVIVNSTYLFSTISGAGKTTLLAAISRRDKSAMTGYLMLNGRLAGADLISRISGFVPQEDLAIEDLTVAEHMEFMVNFKKAYPLP